MNEDILSQLSINEVFNLMEHSMKELSEAKIKNNKDEIEDKTEKVEFLKKFLTAKRSEFRAGHYPPIVISS